MPIQIWIPTLATSKAESSLPLEVHAFAAGPAPCFQGDSTVHLEKGLISIINRCFCGYLWFRSLAARCVAILMGGPRNRHFWMWICPSRKPHAFGTNFPDRFDPVPHLSLDAALRMILAAERLAEAGLSWQQTLLAMWRFRGAESSLIVAMKTEKWAPSYQLSTTCKQACTALLFRTHLSPFGNVHFSKSKLPR